MGGGKVGGIGRRILKPGGMVWVGMYSCDVRFWGKPLVVSGDGTGSEKAVAKTLWTDEALDIMCVTDMLVARSENAVQQGQHTKLRETSSDTQLSLYPISLHPN